MKPYDWEFARVFDIIVHEKPEALANETELSFITRACTDKCPREVKDVLDVGCGKGRFLIPLVQKGYQLTGLDNSPDMLKDCRARLDRRGLQANLVQADMETLSLDRQCDALICMDSVLCYLLETDKIIDVLSRFRQALRPQGILVLDIWNILAQWPDFGETISYKFEDERWRVEWSEHHEYETFTSIFRTEFSGHWVEDGVRREFQHQEIVRAMTSGEVQAYLKEAGFAQVVAYPSYASSESDQVDSEVMLFLGIRP